MSHNIYSLNCGTWTAKLYTLTSTGERAPSPLFTTPVQADGSYKFTQLSSAKVKLGDADYPKYVVAIEGCGKTFQRTVTSAKNQDVTPSSDLLARSMQLLAPNSRTVQQVSISSLDALAKQMDSADPADLHAAFTALSSDTQKDTLFTAAFGFDADDLRYLPPDIQVGTNPSSASENTTVPLAVTATHWHPAYSKRVLWYDGSTYLGEGENFNLPVGKNMQGTRTLTIRSGFSAGPSAIDLTKKYSESSVTMTIADTYPVQAPVLTRTAPSGTIATSRNLTLAIATGVAQADCGTFSSLAITEDQLTAPLSPTDYTITCSASPSQSLAYSLVTASEGTKVLRLWAMDSSGNISPASSLNVPLDTVTPSAPIITRLSANYTNSLIVQIQNANCNDNATKILFSESSTTPLAADAGWQTCAAQNYNFSIAAGDGAKTIYAFLKDDADHVSPSSNITLTLDQTLPSLTFTSAPTLNERLRGGAAKTLTWNSTEVNFGSTPISIELSSDGGSTWTASGSAIANSGSASWNVPLYTGSNFKLRLKGVDLAGNIGYTATSPTFAIDSTSPNVTLTSLTGGQLLKGGSSIAITWSATDSLLAANPISIDFSSDNGGSWTAVATSLANSGTYTWTVPSANGSSYRVRVSAVDAVGLIGSAQSASSFIIDSTAPAITLLSLTGGQTIPGSGATATILWTASDARLINQPISLEYSANSGSSWSPIASGLANSGSYAWSVGVADGTQYRVRVSAVDQVGNIGTAASTTDFAVSSSAPQLTQTTSPSTINSKTLTQVTYGGACQTGLSINVTGAETTSLSCPAGTWSWTTSTVSTDATRTYSFSQTNAIPLTTTITATWTRDTVAPGLATVSINGGDAVTAVPQVRVDVTALESNIDVRIAMAEAGTGNCQTMYADNNWLTHSATTVSHIFGMPIGDGAKKLCVWTRDSAQNVSVISPATGTDGVNTDSISLEAGTPPVITSFSVVNDVSGGTTHASGDRLRIAWTINDAEGLSNNPVTLDYTTDSGATWLPITLDYGGLSGYPTTYTNTYYAFNAPTTGVFRVRIRAIDSAGNTALPVISNVQNSGRWNIYAGNTDKGIGGEAKTVRLKMPWSGQFNSYAIHPQNGDIYILNDGVEVIKVDRSTGRTSTFITRNLTSPNLPDGGAIPAAATARLQSSSRILFDKNGKLYLSTNSDGNGSSSSTIYQFDLVQNTVRKYIGGGSVYDATATATTAQVSGGGMSFDSSNTLYYFAYCTPGVFDTTSTVRLMKVTQQPDGTAGTFSVVAGNCVRGAPVAASTATSSPITNINEISVGLYGKVATNGDGSKVYFRVYNQAMYKIQNTKIYTSSISNTTSDFMIDGMNDRLYSTVNGNVVSWNITGTGNLTETSTTLAAANGTDADCWNDGKPSAASCVNSYAGALLGPDRVVYFIDNITSSGVWRIRYIDANNTIRTVAGGKPVYGEGMSRDLIKTDFSSIYYKQTSEPNQAAFPAGLYFMSTSGFIMGYVDDNTNMSVLWGNQKSASGVTIANGIAINTTSPIGGNGFIGTYPMSFDINGLPWFRLNEAVISLDTDKKTVWRSAPTTPGYSAYWDDGAPGDAAKKYGVGAHGGARNMTMKKSEGLFLLGRGYIPTQGRNAQEPILRYFDYSADVISHVMGGTGTTTTADTSGSLATASFASVCVNNNTGCTTRFSEGDPSTAADDVLYFAEGSNLRKIAAPLIPASNVLSTMMTVASTIQNYILSADGKYVYYIRNSSLYCHAINIADQNTICKNSVASHVNLGPPTGMTNLADTVAGDSMTWRSSTRLLINNAKGEIYEVNVAP